MQRIIARGAQPPAAALTVQLSRPVRVVGKQPFGFLQTEGKDPIRRFIPSRGPVFPVIIVRKKNFGDAILFFGAECPREEFAVKPDPQGTALPGDRAVGIIIRENTQALVRYHERVPALGCEFSPDDRPSVPGAENWAEAERQIQFVELFSGQAFKEAGSPVVFIRVSGFFSH